MRLVHLVALTMVVLVCCQPSDSSATSPATREEVIAAARQIIKEARFCALITIGEAGRPQVRTMEPFEPTDEMVVWFGTNRLSRKVTHIQADPRVSLYYTTGDDGYVAIQGTARLVDDPKAKTQWWNEEWTEFYPDRDATYLLIAVTPESMDVVSSRHNLRGDQETWKPPSIRFP